MVDREGVGEAGRGVGAARIVRSGEADAELAPLVDFARSHDRRGRVDVGDADPAVVDRVLAVLIDDDAVRVVDAVIRHGEGRRRLARRRVRIADAAQVEGRDGVRSVGGGGFDGEVIVESGDLVRLDVDRMRHRDRERRPFQRVRRRHERRGRGHVVDRDVDRHRRRRQPVLVGDLEAELVAEDPVHVGRVQLAALMIDEIEDPVRIDDMDPAGGGGRPDERDVERIAVVDVLGIEVRERDANGFSLIDAVGLRVRILRRLRNGNRRGVVETIHADRQGTERDGVLHVFREVGERGRRRGSLGKVREVAVGVEGIVAVPVDGEGSLAGDVHDARRIDRDGDDHRRLSPRSRRRGSDRHPYRSPGH